MIKRLTILLALLGLAPAVVASDSSLVAEQFGLAHLTDYLGLTPGDISFRSDYTEPDSIRLALVARLMNHPLDTRDYLHLLKEAHVPKQPEILAHHLLTDLALQYRSDRSKAYQPDLDELQRGYNLTYLDPTLNSLLSKAALYLEVIFPRSAEMSLARLTEAQRAFLTNEFAEVIRMSVDDEFLSVMAADSLEKIEEAYIERMAGFATVIDSDPINRAGIDCLRELRLDIKALQSAIRTDPTAAEDLLRTTGLLPGGAGRESYLGLQSGWKVGGPGNDYYQGDYRFILDLGGDDVYDLEYDPSDPHGVIIIDLDGDDHYRGQSDFALGSGCLSVGLLLDLNGDDRYDGQSFSLGSAWFGFGLLYDAAGDDQYHGDTHVQGAATFGVGLLLDEGGRDIYNAALFAQGFGFVQGVGLIYDQDGSDSYYAGGKYKDFGRYLDHYLSMSQGFGYGLRPWLSGGVGAIIDLGGNDSYQADIFAQASAYWWSLGLIYDSTGHDRYHCFQYGQGSGTHMAIGVLLDGRGDDTYFGKGVMQGCGHDYSLGWLLDRDGNDTYVGVDKVQAAGSANGIGLLMDLRGNDRYFARNPKLSQGSGDARRGFGSLGLFIDLGGTDQYLPKGEDNSYWQSEADWGGGMDIEMTSPDSVITDEK